jgi:hypothetical protein
MSGALVFPRGSHVLEYWLAHAEGFTLRSHGPVERVIVEPLYGRATALVVRTGRLRRREVVSAALVRAVDPTARVLELDEPAKAPSGPGAATRMRAWVGPLLHAATPRRAWLAPGRRATSRSRAWLAPRLHAAALAAWALLSTLAAAAVETGRVLAERRASWYASHRDAAQVRRRQAEVRARHRAREGARLERGATDARARRPRGAVGRHLRP